MKAGVAQAALVRASSEDSVLEAHRRMLQGLQQREASDGGQGASSNLVCRVLFLATSWVHFVSQFNSVTNCFEIT